MERLLVIVSDTRRVPGGDARERWRAGDRRARST
jgi:hypothetical protein